MTSRRFVLLTAALMLPLTGPLTAGVDRWTPIGPEGGPILSLAVDPQNHRILYAGTEVGVFKSTNRAKRWRPAMDGLTDPVVTALAIDPAVPDTVYAGTATGRVFRSTDAGDTWAESADRLGQGPVYSLAVHPADTGAVWAGTFEGVFVSTDSGVTWTARNGGLPAAPAGVLDLALHPSAPGIAYAVARRDVFRTTDGGASWVPRDQGLPRVIGIALDPTSPSTLYAIDEVEHPYPAEETVYKSTDGGGSWFAANPEPAGVDAADLLVVPTSPPRLYVSGRQGVIRSDDGGATWTEVREGVSPVEAAVLAVNPDVPFYLFAGTRAGGVFRSSDAGRSWSAVNRGLVATSITDLVPDPGDPSTLFVVAEDVVYESTSLYLGTSAYNGIYRSREGRSPWTDLTRGDYTPGIDRTFGPLAGASPSSVYAGVPYGKSAQTVDCGDTWTVGDGLACILPETFVVDPSTPGTLYLSGELATPCLNLPPPPCFHGHGKSTDGGVSWGCIDFAPLAVDPADPLVLYARSVGEDVGLHKSTDGGATWTLADSGLPAGLVAALVVDPATPTNLYAGTSMGLYRSTDGAGLWEPAGQGLPPGPVEELALDPQDSSNLYAAVQRSGVFRSGDGAASWEPLAVGLPEGALVTRLAVDPARPHILYAATDGFGAFRYTRRTPGVCAEDEVTLCLNEGRFSVRAAWEDFRGRTGVGHAVRLTGDTGTFWFFREGNVELVVKVLDGRPVNDRFWVFYGALSTVQYRIDVTDTATGELRSYFNPARNLASRADVGAFEDGGEGSVNATASSPDRWPWEASTSFATVPASGCPDGETSLCLNDNRFRVEVEWRDFTGGAGVGTAVPLTGDTGAFWFFDPANVELVVKVLDGRPVNGHFWVFSGALSNVEYSLRVTDTVTGVTRSYFNPARRLASFSDVEAF